VRNIDISRSDAEHIVDLFEAEGIPQYLELSDALRAEFGMSYRARRWIVTVGDTTYSVEAGSLVIQDGCLRFQLNGRMVSFFKLWDNWVED